MGSLSSKQKSEFLKLITYFDFLRKKIEKVVWIRC